MAALRSGLERRAERALERQLEYQRKKARMLAGHEAGTAAHRMERSLEVRSKLESVRAIREEDRVLEVGCGAHGLIFFFGVRNAVGVDPLADHYAKLFPQWQNRARTIVASGEDLPFPDSSFDIVLCDNVVDHALSPRRILEEIARVLAPGGLFYFSVNVHHPFYHLAASVHAGWRALGIPFEITPFADHTVHLTPAAARRLFEGLPFRILNDGDDSADARHRREPVRHRGDRLKRVFFKNARYEAVAIRAEDDPSAPSQ
jgi:SAM-dependent methyltransferase